MPPFVTFIMRRLLAIPITLLVLTATLYAVIMLAPVEVRAELYMPKGNSNNPNLKTEVMLKRVIEEYGLEDPYPVQYMRWLSSLSPRQFLTSGHSDSGCIEALRTHHSMHSNA